MLTKKENLTKNIFLIEIGTEEIPAALLYNIAHSFYINFIKELKLYNIFYESIHWFATPRRLALKIQGIDISEKIIIKNKKGPSIVNAFDKDGRPTNSAQLWARYCGININEAKRLKNNKGEWLFYQKKIKQESAVSLLPKCIEFSLKKICIEKTMRWERTNQKFCRPIRNIVMLLNDDVISSKIFNIPSNNILHNHLSSKEKKIIIKNAKEYPLILLQKEKIIANYNDRKQKIKKILEETVQKVNGTINLNNPLIEEATSSVESPIAFLANFKKKFLKIPKEILIYTIEKLQKCFTICNHKEEVLPYFIFISNISSKKPDQNIIGYEKVMHARLSDTEFFLKKDKKIKLKNYLPYLKNILFYQDLGSLYEKTFRLKFLMEWISQNTNNNIKNAIQAALLSKCDLISDMVYEFPELQGIIGMYYTCMDPEINEEVSIAIKEQYLPSFSGDKLPLSVIGASLSIADKMDTITGMFCINRIPTSNKDPFALRRLSIGILRIIIEKKIILDFKKLIKKSIFLHQKEVNCSKIYNQIIKFFMSRLFYLYEKKGYNIKIIQSVLSCKLTQLIDIHKRIKAISYFRTLSSSKSIITSIKRIHNIIENHNQENLKNINVHLIQEKEEKILLNKINKFIDETKNLFLNQKYKDILIKMHEFKNPINNFFEKVKIYHSNSEIKANRLAILRLIKKTFLKITNFKYLF
ncbi:glycine--tRNA ligase subunit beta [Buchnera aphidicola (Muscaphis stroyani)]|uniref:Glycine--tRNA ligase beta subunit n=1 Tax=Buchnera aphidicola (Muscaphis stroyani) TaxID=1241869 RepID=A0A4D6YEK4_9GAMM|nr:glycine--tRNA ligase subunit beta [Buchnera aphidicola]QCI24234.1 glycine--tRNA ligase subunit beta [Buchnera aphidicola (Muscaphis stroyani)]